MSEKSDAAAWPGGGIRLIHDEANAVADDEVYLEARLLKADEDPWDNGTVSITEFTWEPQHKERN